MPEPEPAERPKPPRIHPVPKAYVDPILIDKMWDAYAKETLQDNISDTLQRMGMIAAARAYEQYEREKREKQEKQEPTAAEVDPFDSER